MLYLPPGVSEGCHFPDCKFILLDENDYEPLLSFPKNVHICKPFLGETLALRLKPPGDSCQQAVCQRVSIIRTCDRHV